VAVDVGLNRTHSTDVSPKPTRPYEELLGESFDSAIREADAYFMKAGRLHRTIRDLASRLKAESIDYALIGGMALSEHGYVRMTDDVSVLLTAAGLKRFRERLEGKGYVAVHPGAARSFRDAETGVRIEFLVAGEFPGDGKPKEVAFPDPAAAGEDIDGVTVLKLPRVIELKLASGMSARHRLRDLADVQELIRARELDRDFAAQLHVSVRDAYLRMLADVQSESR
jgi:hypothetical protein